MLLGSADALDAVLCAFARRRDLDDVQAEFHVGRDGGMGSRASVTVGPRDVQWLHESGAIGGVAVVSEGARLSIRPAASPASST